MTPNKARRIILHAEAVKLEFRKFLTAEARELIMAAVCQHGLRRLAAAANYAPSYLSLVANGHHRPAGKTVWRILAAADELDLKAKRK